MNGAILTSNRFSNSNSAYDFNFNGMSWDAGRHQAINIPFNASFNSNTITVSMWFLARSYFYSGIPTADKISRLIGKIQGGYSNPNGQTWAIDLRNNTINVSVVSASAVNNQISLSASANISLNQWNFVVFTYDNVSIKLFLNGSLVSETQKPPTFSINTLGNSGISVGSSDQANGYWYESDAKIDEIGFWNRALTQAEITGLFTTLGTTQTEAVNQIAIYPNPAKDQITIDFGNVSNVSGCSYSIVNTLGQEVSKGVMNSQQNVVSLNTLNCSGVYFVKIYDASNNLLNTKKIILQ